MITSLKTPIALIAVLALSAACSSSVAPQSGLSTAPADVHIAMPGYKNSQDALGLGQPPVAAPAEPVMKPASVTFASSREFQEFPVQPVTNSIFLDVDALNVGNEYMLSPAIPATATTKSRVVSQRKMIPTQFREVIQRTAVKTDRTGASVYASTFGDLLVE